jgi:hypothetical protein
MFKRIEKSWYDLINGENFTLISMKVGDILFTPFKKKASTFNRKFPANLTWSKDQVKLREEIRNKKYDPSLGKPIAITKDGICVEGHHRVSSLIEYYGEDYVITVRKINTKYRYILFLITIILIIKPSLIKNS